MTGQRNEHKDKEPNGSSGKPIDDGIKVERVDGQLREVNTKTKTVRDI